MERKFTATLSAVNTAKKAIFLPAERDKKNLENIEKNLPFLRGPQSAAHGLCASSSGRAMAPQGTSLSFANNVPFRNT